MYYINTINCLPCNGITYKSRQYDMKEEYERGARVRLGVPWANVLLTHLHAFRSLNSQRWARERLTTSPQLRS